MPLVPPLIISLPIADRHRTADFYRSVLGSSPVGEPTEDGLPEPLTFEPSPGVHLMFVPSGGFGWVIGDRDVADPGASECVIGFGATDPDDVDAMVARALAAGGSMVVAPAPQPWGYSGCFADPDGHLSMVTVV